MHLKDPKSNLCLLALVSSLMGCLENPQPTDESRAEVKFAADISTCNDSVAFSVVQTNGAAQDIAVGPNSVWVIGLPENGHGYRIYKRNGTGWQDYGGGAVRIAMNGDVPIVVNDVGTVYRLTSTWSAYTSAGSSWGQDVAAGPTDIWTLKATAVPCCAPERYDASTTPPTWNTVTNQLPANTAKRISGAVSSSDMWIVSKEGPDASPVWVVRYNNGDGNWREAGTWSREVYDVAGAGNGVAYITQNKPGLSGAMYRIKYGSSCAQPVVNQADHSHMWGGWISSKSDNDFWYIVGSSIYHATR